MQAEFFRAQLKKNFRRGTIYPRRCFHRAASGGNPGRARQPLAPAVGDSQATSTLRRGCAVTGGRVHARVGPDRCPDPGGSLLRTEFIGRNGGDGNIELLGRAEDFARINGFRVNLRQVEAFLRPSSRRRPEVAAAAFKQESGEYQLTCYVVLKPGTSPTEKDLRLFLKGKISDFTLPAHIVTVASLPKDAQGEVVTELLLGAGAPGQARAGRKDSARGDSLSPAHRNLDGHPQGAERHHRGQFLRAGRELAAGLADDDADREALRTSVAALAFADRRDDRQPRPLYRAGQQRIGGTAGCRSRRRGRSSLSSSCTAIGRAAAFIAGAFHNSSARTSRFMSCRRIAPPSKPSSRSRTWRPITSRRCAPTRRTGPACSGGYCIGGDDCHRDGAATGRAGRKGDAHLLLIDPLSGTPWLRLGVALRQHGGQPAALGICRRKSTSSTPTPSPSRAG